LGYTCGATEPPLLSLSIIGLDHAHIVEHCSGVYEPAEDTWLTERVLNIYVERLRPRICIDVGTGTGVLAAACSRFAETVYATDINPCAAICAALNLKRLAAINTDVVQCSTTSCLRCPRRGPVLVVFNTPYLPPGEEVDPYLDIAWSGGAEPALEVLRAYAECVRRIGGCLLLTTHGLWQGAIAAEAAKLGLEARSVAEERYFFESIAVVEACARKR